MRLGSFLLIFVLIWVGSCLDNGLGLNPPMGWNSWNKFGCKINETVIKKTVDQLVKLGLREKGYKYVNLDDCWQVILFEFRSTATPKHTRSNTTRVNSLQVFRI